MTTTKKEKQHKHAQRTNYPLLRTPIRVILYVIQKKIIQIKYVMQYHMQFYNKLLLAVINNANKA